MSNYSRYVVAYSSKCTGCKACEVACFAEHNRKSNKIGYTVGKVTVPVTAKLYLTKVDTNDAAYCMPIQCKHCEDAPCLNACQKHAIYRTEDNQVIVNEDKCIGCKDYVMACPFGAIAILPKSENGTFKLQKDGEIVKAASKCDLCEGIEGGPACVRVCPNESLKLIDANEEILAKNIKADEGLYTSRV